MTEIIAVSIILFIIAFIIACLLSYCFDRAAGTADKKLHYK